jgi:Raf kinase inhibitor-like YbhB/YbcL family protein
MAEYKLPIVVGLLLVAGCGRGGDAMSTGSSNVQKLTVTSVAFKAGDVVPKEHSGEGADKSPPLAWSGAPAATKEFAIIVHDPDAPVGTWYHWVLYNIPSDVTSLPAGVPKTAVLQTPVKGRQGLNSWSSENVGYRGPMPPPGHGQHRYIYTVYAVDTHIELAPNLATAAALEKKIAGHVLAKGELQGVYERK